MSTIITGLLQMYFPRPINLQGTGKCAYNLGNQFLGRCVEAQTFTEA